MTYGPPMGNIPLHSCVAEQVRNKLTRYGPTFFLMNVFFALKGSKLLLLFTDLLAENNSRTQVSTRFTDQVQTKEPVGNMF